MPKRSRHIPLRSCIACRIRSDKRALFRIVRSPEGVVSLDPTGKVPGRGSYTCLSVECAHTIARRRLLDRAFKTSVPDDVYQRLVEAALRRADCASLGQVDAVS